MATARLDQTGVVELEGVVVRSSGLRGEVTVERAPTGGALRGRSSVNDELERALGALDMRTDRTIVIKDPRSTVTGPPAATTRGRRGAAGGVRPQDLELEVPAPADGEAQVLLSIDEHGIATFHRPQKMAGGAATVRGARRMQRYVVPRVIAPPPAGVATTRGLIPGLSQVIRIITFPIVSAIGHLAQSAARSWDRDHHPHQIRRRLVDGSWAPVEDRSWADLQKGPALLFIHGTFSTTEGAFGRLPADTLAELQRRYDGRVLAFDHPTIADDPSVNVREFLRLVGDRTMAFDIVCHSRGGLVARTLAERPGQLKDLGTNIKVRSAVLVGATCNGTILASADNWDELINRATTLLNLVPGLAVNATLETILAVVRSLAVEVVKDLEGLSCMAPGSDFLKLLNDKTAKPTAARYRAIVSNYEPKDPALVAWLNDEARDWIFKGVPNDMMVAIESMDGPNGYGAFPIKVHRDFQPDEGVEHSDYFGQPMTSKALLGWLKPAPPTVAGGH